LPEAATVLSRGRFTFTVAAGETALPWDIGVHVEVNEDPAEARLVYISSLSCWKE
jgi:hypothetical protein